MGSSPRFMATVYQCGIYVIGALFHVVPFQCSSTGWGLGSAKNLVQPTAQALWAEAANTPMRVPPLAGTGTCTRFHAVPFQRRIRGMAGRARLAAAGITGVPVIAAA